MVYQGCSHQSWSGQVSGVWKSMQQLEGSGGMPLRTFLEFRGYEIASETIFGPKRCFLEARRQSFTTLLHFFLHLSMFRACNYALFSPLPLLGSYHYGRISGRSLSMFV